MEIWIDAQLSPSLAAWLNRTFNDLNAKSIKSLNLRDATDIEIFKIAGKHNVVIMSKDSDFIRLIEQFGTPPKLIWITCGNTSNSSMRKVLTIALPKAIKCLKRGESIVEIR